MVNQSQVAKTIGDSWAKLLWDEFNAPYMGPLQQAVASERRSYDIWPEKQDVFRALKETPYTDLKVVILGQDPYHTPGLANGLAFSVSNDTFDKDVPPSLRNILKEVEEDCGFKDPYPEIDLTRWAKQGVLLLNRVLTVRQHSPESHSNLGWQNFTERVITEIGQAEKSVVFLLWGAYARDAREFIDPFLHWIIESSHPSPLSAHRGFSGSKCFSECNKYLKTNGHTEINW